MQKRSSIIGGLILILAGVFFLALQAFPGLAAFFDVARLWPLIIVAVGAAFLLGAFLDSPPLAIPGSIVGGIGLLLTYQNLTGNWESWAYVWTLIPGFVGLGLILMGILDPEQAQAKKGGVSLLIVSLVLFVVFGGFIGGFGLLGQWWPLLLVFGGLWLLLRNRRARPEDNGPAE